MTVYGTVVHGSKLNNVMGCFWTILGLFNRSIEIGAQVNELYSRWQLDKDSSQAAVTYGGHFVGVRDNQGVSTLLIEMQNKQRWKNIVDPVDLIEEKLWPCADRYDDDNSTFIRPSLTTTP